MASDLGASLPPLPPLLTCTVAVIGMGYVGLPLALEFSKIQKCKRTGHPMARRVIGFDINEQRLNELRSGIDCTHEANTSELLAAEMLEFTSDPSKLEKADVFVVTVPTPIDAAKRPDLKPLVNASSTVGLALKQRSVSGPTTTPVVIYESTVYPGATEDDCVPILERTSGLVVNEGFFCGYSPERINPGDSDHKLSSITKVTSGSTPESAEWVDQFYGSIITAGTHRAPSLKVAEAAKVIENTQRDLNIALVNELAIIFSQMGIDTLDVLEAAGTKWNFLPFRPGLVGGHCIGVDPYYLTHKAEQLGYHPQLVLAGRRINDSMGRWFADKLVLGLAARCQPVVGSRVLVLGLTFKENCPDLRNTKVFDLIQGLERFGMLVDVVDPWIHPEDDHHGTGRNVMPNIPTDCHYAAVILAVAHREFVSLSVNEWRQMLAPGGLLLDLKGIVPRELDAMRL